MQKHSIASFDIDGFYPSITESLLSKAISFAKNYTTISEKDMGIIMHCRKSLLFDNETAWTKKNHSDMFERSGSVWAYRSFSPEQPQREMRQKQRRTLQRRRAGTSKKLTVKEHNQNGLERTSHEDSRNLKICNFLDVTLNLTDGTYHPYRKPNNETLYIDSNSMQPPPTIIKHKLSFRNRNYSNSTELSKHIWTLEDSNTNFTINWCILATAPAYSNKSKQCQLSASQKNCLN